MLMVPCYYTWLVYRLVSKIYENVNSLKDMKIKVE